jgi:GDP-6-deoxy-D-talose 4-dehydrogenase
MTERRALITGINGFTGRYLAPELQAAGYRVFGTGHHGESAGTDVHMVDLCDRNALGAVAAEVRPDVVAHLAAISFVAHGDAETIYRVNLVGTRHLLEALAALDSPPRAVLLASSANVYGNAPVEVIDESVPPVPANDYAVSKLAMEYLARLWLDRLPIVITRPFNYTGLGQSPQFLLPKIVSHFQARAPVIELGNLDVARDFSDVRAVAVAYRRLLEAAPAGEVFNICSGAAHTLTDVLRMMAEIAGYEIQVRVNPAFVRPNEVKRLLGSNRKLVRAIGPLPALPLEATLRWMYGT